MPKFDFGSLKEKETEAESFFSDPPKKVNKPEPIKKEVVEETEFEIVEDTPEINTISVKTPTEFPLAKQTVSEMPSEAEIQLYMDRYKFIKKNLVDKSDFQDIKGKKFMKKSGWRKFINAYGITIELIEKKDYKKYGDIHAEVRVRAIMPSGQSVEGVGLKSMSELYEKTLHNLITNAWTRAVNRAVSDLVGYGAVSAEEMNFTDKGDFF